MRILFLCLWMTLGVCLEPSVLGAEFAGGDGTKENPWKIKTREQLAALSNYLGSKGSGRYFCLSSDILFSAEDFAAGGEFYNKGLGWQPIGSQTDANQMFRGSLDGRGHVIRNLTVNRPQTPDIGLFGYTRGAIIKDLRLENLTFTGSTNVGGLTGTDRGSTFQNVSVTGTVSGQKTIGGLVGYAENTILTRCGSDCQVSASLLSMNYTEISSAGGLMGYGQEVEAAECYALGTLSCTTSAYEGRTSGYIYAGGLIGCLKSGSVARSFVKGIVSGSTAAPSSAGDAYVGGLVGYLHVSTVEDSYTQGNIKADARVDALNISANDTGKVYAGGIAGFGVTSSITRSYSSMESSVYAGTGGGCAGGLAGTVSFGTIEDSVAVNPAIHVYSESAKPEVGRISGVYTGTLTGNLASSGMVVVLDQEVVEPVDDASYKDGATTVIERLKTRIPYRTLGWDVQNVWDQQTGSYPNLVWEAEVFDIKEAVITVQPQSVKVKAGETAVFSVTAEGSRLSYVWYHDGEVLRDENENMLMIENAQAEDEGTYQVYVFNSLGGVMSSPAELTLKGSGPVSAIWLRNPEYVEDESGAAYFLFDVEGAAVFSVEGSFNAVDWTEVSYTAEGGKVKIPARYNYVLYRAWAEASYDEEAPKIVNQPQNTKVKEGDPLTLSVTATGSAPLSYQWIFEGLKIEGATNSVYEVEAAQASDAGRYIVTITNPYGSVTSSIATVRVTGITPVVEPPVITQQPVDVTVNEGSSFSLSITATGTEPLAYQWFKDGAEIEGATASVYEVTTAQTGDSGSYTVRVSNEAGTVTSRETLVAVNKVVPPTPIDNLELIYREVRKVGNTYYLVFDVKGSNTYFIDGSRDGINWESVQYGTLSDGGVIIPMTEEFILYRARTDNVVPPVVEPPVITQQPLDVTVDEGNSFALSVTATGAEPLTYQWFKDGTEIEGATAPVYEVTTAQASDSGSYTVTVSNTAGSVNSSDAIVKVKSVAPVIEPPEIIQQPMGGYVNKGESLFLIAAAKGTMPFKYQWFKDGVPVTEIKTSIIGTLRFSILHAQESDSGRYSVTISNEAGTVTSQVAVVIVYDDSIHYSNLIYREIREIDGAKYFVFDIILKSALDNYQIEFSRNGTDWEQVECERLDDGGIIVPITESFALYRASYIIHVTPSIAIVTQPVGGTFKVGETIRLSVTAEGAESYKYRWYKEDGKILLEEISETSSELIIPNATESDSGSYRVQVIGLGSLLTPVVISDSAVVTVIAEPQEDIWLQNGNVRVDDEEEYITFDVVNAEITKVEMTANGTNWESIEYNISSQNVLSFKYDFDNPLYMVTGVVNGATRRIQFKVANGQIKDIFELD